MRDKVPSVLLHIPTIAIVKPLRLIRMVAAVLFFGATVAYFLIPAGVSRTVGGLTRLHPVSLTLGTVAGVAAVWFIIALVWGRLYCSTVCPVGTLIDGVVWLRRRIPALRRPFRYKNPVRCRPHILFAYVCCLIAGLAVVPLVADPFHIMGNILLPFGGGRVDTLWIQYGTGVAMGIGVGLLSLIVLVPYALLCGRDFCNAVCPLGIALGYASGIAAVRITIDPDKCISCGRCEEECSASAIKVAGRHVDNSRCVRCFRCVAHCPENAIRYTMNRNRPATPLMALTKNMNRHAKT